jgi:hypothetical protein
MKNEELLQAGFGLLSSAIASLPVIKKIVHAR